MQDRFENYLLAQQLDNLVGILSARSGLRKKLAEWVCEEGQAKLGILVPDYDEDAATPPRGMKHLAAFASDNWASDKKQISPAAWRELRAAISKAAKGLKTRTKSALQKNIDALAKEVGFDPIETVILGVAVRLGSDDAYKGLCDSLFEHKKIAINRLLASLLGADLSEISLRLKRSSPLATTGLMKMKLDAWNSDFSDFLGLPDPIIRAVQPPNEGIGDIEAAIFGAPCKAELVWSDFEHLREDRNFVAKLLSGAVREKAKGIIILFYGPPGTGKTEFCKTIAAHLKLNMHAVGEVDEEGNEPERKERIAALRLSDHLLAKHKGTLLLFDEMEDLLGDSMGFLFSQRSSMSKVFTNRILETNSVPTLWTCNQIDEFDPALLRRMSIAIEMRSPPKSVRKRIWKKVLQKSQLSISGSGLSDLAEMFEGPPALAANAVRTVKLAGGGQSQIRYSMNRMARVAGRNVKIHPLANKDCSFNTALLNTDIDLVTLTRRIAGRSVARNFSFCLYGPAGTGKSAYVRHLAKQMGMELIQKRTSDLVSKWLGATEKNIAEAFEEAQFTNVFLIFDEADSLLADRRGAHRSWEVTQVNEMLTWMESHPLPFACTTNLMGNLDPASLRRFTFKVNCRYLSSVQIKATFEHFFGLSAPAEITKLSVLTPGDFAVVKKKAAFTGQLSDIPGLLAMLRDECEIKSDNPSPIGFNATIPV